MALSNSVLVVTPPPSDSSISAVSGREPVVIRDGLHEILELLPTVPKLHKLIGSLRGREYDESDEVAYNDPQKVGSLSIHLHDVLNAINCGRTRATILTRTPRMRYKRVTRNWIVG